MRRPLSSLQGRVVLAATLSAVVVLVSVGVIVVAGSRGDERAALDRRLERRAAGLAERGAIVRLTRPVRRARTPALPLLADDLSVRVIVAGTIVLADGGGSPAALAGPPPTRPGLRTFERGGARWRAATAEIRGGRGGLVEVASSLADVDGTAARLRRRVLVVGLLGLLVAVALASTAAAFAVRSLARLRKAADAVAATERLDLVVPEPGPAEVDAVARALNRMLRRLQASVDARERALEATRRFAADAGHELRTPLAVLQADLDTLARNPDLPPDQRQAIVADTLAEHRRLSDLVAALQALTRGDGGAMGDERAVDVAALVESAVAQLRTEHPTGEVAFETERRPIVQASPTGLRLLVDNLLQNAARHGRRDGLVRTRVHLEQTPGGTRLVVDDDGPGIPEADRTRVTERFARGPGAAGEGSGLGLAIARQQAERLGGALRIEATPGSGGARVLVDLPSVAAAEGRA